ncbi:MAG TPA: alpha/beta hydrolase [Acidimicrobiia bacterium]|nr:alpha/beta hydrolase [Acidimicrobiia bacterium]
MKLLRRLLIVVATWRLIGPPLRPRFIAHQEHPFRVPARTYFVGDLEFGVREQGPPDAPALVMIHGLAGSSLAEWYKVVPLLSDRHRVIMIDHRSHGFSHTDRGRFEIDDDADDVAAVMAQLHVDQAVVVGYSMGGTVAQSLAYRHPHLVSGLVLVGTMSHHPPAWRWARIVGVIITRGWERLTGTGTPEVRTIYLLATGAVDPKHAQWLWDETHRRDPDAGAAASLALFRFDSRSWLARVQQPVLVIIPTRDQLVPVSWQYELASGMANAEVREVIKGHHELPWSHPDVLAEAIDAFVKQHVGDPSPLHAQP